MVGSKEGGDNRDNVQPAEDDRSCEDKIALGSDILARGLPFQRR